jgi:hypothetical protein
VIKAAIPFGFEAVNGEEYLERLRPYPTTAGATLDAPASLPVVVWTARGYGPVFAWSRADRNGSPDDMFDDIAPEYRYVGERWLLPGLGSNLVAPAPLMVWWALLYGFSMLARYEPRLWVKSLDLNASPVAVLIQDALDEALVAVPHLVAEALLRTRILEPPRIPVWNGRLTGSIG